MKVPVYVREQNEAFGLFLGHAEHTELESVVELFSGPSPEEVYVPNGFDPGNYQLIGTQLAADKQEKNLVFEIILGANDE